MECPGCATVNPAENLFCARCGTSLAPVLPPPAPVVPDPPGGRRWVAWTVAACLAAGLGGAAGFAWWRQRPATAFREALAAQRLMVGEKSAFVAYLEAVQTAGSDSRMVQDMGRQALPILEQRSSAFLEEGPAAGKARGISWAEYALMQAWLQRIAPSPAHAAGKALAQGRMMLLEGRTTEARAHFQEAIALAPGWAPPVEGLAVAQERLGDLAAAQASRALAQVLPRRQPAPAGVPPSPAPAPAPALLAPAPPAPAPPVTADPPAPKPPPPAQTFRARAPEREPAPQPRAPGPSGVAIDPLWLLGALILGLPFLLALAALTGRVGLLERTGDRLGAWCVNRRAASDGVRRSWGQESSRACLWAFAATARVTAGIRRPGLRTAVRFAAWWSLLLLMTALVAGIVYIVVVVTLTVLALWLFWKIMVYVLKQWNNSPEEDEVREEAPKRSFWSAPPEPEPARGRSWMGGTRPCRACGAPVSHDVEDCPRCGENQESFKLLGADGRTCRFCGSAMSWDGDICRQCGENQETFKLLGPGERGCRHCGAPVSWDVEVCPRCGEDQERFKLLGAGDRRCRLCGAPVSEDVELCRQCGENQEPFKFLGASGRPCRACGALLSDDLDHCPKCGEDQATFKLLG